MPKITPAAKASLEERTALAQGLRRTCLFQNASAASLSMVVADMERVEFSENEVSTFLCYCYYY